MSSRRCIWRRDRSPGGAIYGTSSNGRRAAFVRPGNRGARAGLYLVGGSSHPGGGLPLVLTGARIVAEMVGRRGAASCWRRALAARRPASPASPEPRAPAAARAGAAPRRWPSWSRRATRRPASVRCWPRWSAPTRVDEVIVVDDESTDATAAIAAAARVPGSWRAAGAGGLGRQGVGAAAGARRRRRGVGGDPRRRHPPVARAARGARRPSVADGLGFVTVGGRFECPTAGLRWLHPAMLTTLVYRFAPPGAVRRARCSRQRPVHGVQPRRAGRRRRLRRRRRPGRRGRRARRAMATAGFAVAMLDASDLLTVRMYETPATRGGAGAARWRCPAWTAAAGSSSSSRWRSRRPRRSARRGPPRRSARRRAAGAARRHAGRHGRRLHRRGPAYWLSPIADVVAVAALVRSSIGPAAGRGGVGATQSSARAACQNRSPTIDMSPPVAAVRTGPSMSTWATG